MSDEESYVVIKIDSKCEVMEFSYFDVSIYEAGHQFKIIDIPIYELKERSKEEMFAMIGRSVITTFERMRSSGIGFAELVDNNENSALERAYKTIEERANKGDAHAQNALASKFLSESIEKEDVSCLEHAEYWFKQSAENGYEEAIKFLDETWPEVKKAYRKRILGER